MSDRNQSLEIYMSEVLKYPLLSSKEELELGLQAKAGNKKAIDLLVKSNLRLVVKIAHNFRGLGVSLNDLVAEGNLGLMSAARKFDPSKGAKFSSYSALWIKQSIRNAIAKLGRTVRIPIQSLSRISKIYVAQKKLNSEYHREPTTKELSEYLELPEPTVKRLLKVDISNTSLNSHTESKETHSELIEIVKDPDYEPLINNLYLQEDLSLLKAEYNSLRDREKMIINWRFGLDGEEAKTLEEISQVMGVSRERVRQIQKTGLRRLRKLIEKRR